MLNGIADQPEQTRLTGDFPHKLLPLTKNARTWAIN
jgi:hypothetical protein